MSRPPLLARLRSFFDTLRGSYWFLPMMMALGAGAFAFGLVELDRKLLVDPIPWVSSTGPEGTRSVLSVIAGSMITVTGVVFSITVVALTLASSQFGPRLLRNFLRDRGNQLAFGTFVATFLYSLLVMRAVRDDEIPHLAATVAVVLATASLFVLIYFIHHTATSIQASSVIAAVAKEIDAQIVTLFPERIGREDSDRSRRNPTARQVETPDDLLKSVGAEILASSDGFVRVVDPDAVLGLAVDHDAVIVLHRRPGDFVVAGTVLARVTPANRAETLSSALRNSFVLGDHRTAVQDVRFLIGQLTEIASRALSSGINDPRTACDCVHRLGAVVSAIADRKMPSGDRYDDEGRVRVLARATTFQEIVASSFDPIRRYGAEHVTVVKALLDAIGDVGQCCADPHRRRVLVEHARETYGIFIAKHRSARDVAEIHEAFDDAMEQLVQPRAPEV